MLLTWVFYASVAGRCNLRFIEHLLRAYVFQNPQHRNLYAPIKVQQWYAVQECDARMLNRITNVRPKKLRCFVNNSFFFYKKPNYNTCC
jgi:hypothetical protein